MIIGLKGLKGSGKDTVAAYLIKQHGFERRAFADLLKKSVAALLEIPYHEIDNWKNDSRIHVEVVEYASEDDAGHKDGNYAFVQGQTLRSFLQRYGTEAHRDVFGDNFWLDYTLPVDGYYGKRNIAITDCRFENEARRVNMVGGFVVQIHRPGHVEQDQHRSEQLLPPKMVDYELMNHTTIEDLYARVEDMLVDLGGIDARIRRVMG